jgi:hypothetical protein
MAVHPPWWVGARPAGVKKELARRRALPTSLDAKGQAGFTKDEHVVAIGVSSTFFRKLRRPKDVSIQVWF